MVSYFFFFLPGRFCQIVRITLAHKTRPGFKLIALYLQGQLFQAIQALSVPFS